jgi:hypothetical protein
MISVEYIAGLFDGEGWFHMQRCSLGKRYTIRPWRYQCYASIALREKWLLEDINKSIGIGKVSESKKETDKHAASFRILFTGKSLPVFIDCIIPYLRLKKRQAILVREVCDIKTHIGNQPVSDTDYNRQVEIWEKMHVLNQKGITRLFEEF